MNLHPPVKRGEWGRRLMKYLAGSCIQSINSLMMYLFLCLFCCWWLPALVVHTSESDQPDHPRIHSEPLPRAALCEFHQQDGGKVRSHSPASHLISDFLSLSNWLMLYAVCVLLLAVGVQ